MVFGQSGMHQLVNKERGQELEERSERNGAVSHCAVSSPIGDIASTILKYLRSTSKRDFVVIPIIVLIEQAISRRALRFWGAPLMIWGYLQYRLSGEYRNRIGLGGPGLSGPPPAHLVTSGIYSVTRNPMYTGHIIFLAGLAICTGSPAASAVAVAVVPWFRNRIIENEQQLKGIFGEEFEDYAKKVGRWGPRFAPVSRTRAMSIAPEES